jgi:hypothetical protein
MLTKTQMQTRSEGRFGVTAGVYLPCVERRQANSCTITFAGHPSKLDWETGP